MDYSALFAATFDLLGQGWVLLVLLASLMFAIGNYVDELLLTDFEQPIGVLVVISGLFGFVLAAIFAILALIMGTTLWLPVDVALQAIGVGALEMVWVIPYLYALERRGAMIAGPLFQVVPVIALGLESLTGIVPPMLQLAGVIAIIIGGVILSLEKEEGEDGTARHTIDWVTIGLMSLSAVLVALIYVLFKDAVMSDAGYLAVGFWSALGIGLTGLAILAVWRPYRREFREFCQAADGKAVLIQLGNELMDQGGAYLTHYANVIGAQAGFAIGVVTAFNATQPIAIWLIGALLALFGLRTREAGSNGVWFWVSITAAIALIALGVALIALGQPS